MIRFPPTISRKSRLVYGLLGIVAFMTIWWLITLPMPFLTETQVLREAIVDADDKIVGYREVPREVRRAAANPPGLDTPWNTFERAFEIDLPQHILWSTTRILLGFLISISIAVPLGIAMGLFPRLRATINPMISLLRPLPSIAWVPLAAIWLGAGESQKIAIVLMGSFAAALIYTIEATHKVDPDLIRAATNLGANRRQLLARVLLPAALPSILSGMKVVLAICWTCVISAEIVGTQFGLGSLIWDRKEISDTAAILVGMFSIGLIMLVLDAIFNWIERRLVPYMFLKRDAS